MMNFDSILQTPIDQTVHITREYKDALERYAVAYAKERDEYRAKNSQTMSEKELKRLLPITANLAPAWKMAYRLFSFRNNRWYYPGKDLGNHDIDWAVFIGDLLKKYDPEEGKFITFLEYMIPKHIADYHRSLNESKPILLPLKEGQEKQEEIKVELVSADYVNPDDGTPLLDALPSTLSTLTPDIVDTLIGYGNFATCLVELCKLYRSEGDHEKSRRYRTYYTRDVVKGVCPNFISEIDIIGPDANRVLAQPYIKYIQISPDTNPDKQYSPNVPPYAWIAKEINSDSRFKPVTLIRLAKLYRDHKLDKEKYDKEKTLNVYFGMTNLHTHIKAFRKLTINFYDE